MLIEINSFDDIPLQLRNTPIGELLEYHNLDKKIEPCTQAQLLIGMCMDNRKSIRIPDNYAFIIRSGGANLRYSEFKVSFAIAIGNISHIALIAHTCCGMVDLASKKDDFVSGLAKKAGWDLQFAEEHFNHFAPLFEIGNENDFVVSEANRLRNRYPKVTVVPLLYKVEDNRLYLIDENNSNQYSK
ncbi:MAG: carbonic anhydrase [Melioribacteraceae bacterium]|nr:carbonic anhydrase [Melioribacteraceae bacterium]MCF8263646.1 carbonic anhydrase [Melioribacteraceae bacterium]MCF8431432.1 carbonic anhydrase [Melioribacteraceae bacterium]